MDKSIVDDILKKAWQGSTRQTDFGSSHSSTPNPSSSTGGKDYAYDPKKQELSVSTFENGSQKRLDKRVLATTKENEKKLKNASIESDLMKSIDAIIEKAVYGAGASGGKFQRGSGKDESKPGAVKRPSLSEEQKKKIISGAQAKASSQAASTGMHGLAAKIRAEKSLDERTTDLVKALNVDYGPRKSGVKRGGYRQDPDAGIDKKKEEKMKESDPRDRPAVRSHDNFQYSLDERTCDLTKDMSQQREREIHDAVSTVRMTREDVPEAAKMDVEPEDVHRAYLLHSNLTKPKTQKSICDKWQTGSAFITKGARVMPLGPGGEVQTLSKNEDEDEDNGAE